MGWMELMLIGVVALIVVGPKDLPVMFQSLGKMTAKVRRMARDFQSAMNDAANATGAADVASDLKSLTSPKALGIDKLRDAADKFDKWEPGVEPKVMGSETAKLAAERAEQTRKVQAALREKGQAKLDLEKANGDAAKAKPTGSKATKSKGTAKATKPKPEAAGSGTKSVKPKVTKPKATKPASSKPAASKAKTTKPTATKPKTAKPKPTKPKPATPRAAKPAQGKTADSAE